MKTKEYMNLLKNGRVKEAEKLRQSTIPVKLIKFIWLDGSETDEKKFETLKRDEIWFSNKSFLNDPYEFEGMIIDRDKLQINGYPDAIINMFEKMLTLDQFGITCFSANEIDYLPMWAYYTNNHKGFCVEYEVTEKKKIHEVFYEQERIKIARIAVDYMSALEKTLSSNKQTAELDSLGTILMQNLFIKAEQWKHEKEYRIIWEIGDKIGENVSVSELGLKTSKIFAGTKCDVQKIKRLNDISNSLGLGNVYKSCIHPEHYTIEVERY